MTQVKNVLACVGVGVCVVGLSYEYRIVYRLAIAVKIMM